MERHNHISEVRNGKEHSVKQTSKGFDCDIWLLIYTWQRTKCIRVSVIVGINSMGNIGYPDD